MMKIGYKLISVADKSIIQSWGGTWGYCPDQPAMIICPNGAHVHCPALDTEYGTIGEEPGSGVMLIEWLMEEPPPPPPIVPEEISDRQFFQQLAIMQVITKSEALAAVKIGEIPAALQAVIDSLDENTKFAAEMTVSGAVIFHRSHPLTSLLSAHMNWTSEQADDLWTKASRL